jgi:hypothetical protein
MTDTPVQVYLGPALRNWPPCPGTIAVGRHLRLIAPAWSVLRRTGGVQHLMVLDATAAGAAVASSSSS